MEYFFIFSYFLGSRGKVFVVLFMKYGYDVIKNIYVIFENGV